MSFPNDEPLGGHQLRGHFYFAQEGTLSLRYNSRAPVPGSRPVGASRVDRRAGFDIVLDIRYKESPWPPTTPPRARGSDDEPRRLAPVLRGGDSDRLRPADRRARRGPGHGAPRAVPRAGPVDRPRRRRRVGRRPPADARR